MFEGCASLEELNISNLDISRVQYMQRMFSGCSSLVYLNLSTWRATYLNDMSSMFSGCSKLEVLDLSNFDTSQVTTMHELFKSCNSLKELDLSNFITINVENMNSMFYGCSNLTSLNLSNFETSKVLDMANMFALCSSIISLNISHFDTSKITNTASMFEGCSKLKELDLSNFNTQNVNTMNNMFKDCSSLKILDLSNFDTSLVINMDYIFYGCSELEYINLKNGIKNASGTFNNMFNLTSENLLLCCYDGSWESLFQRNINIHCLDNNNSNINNFICFTQNLNIYNTNFTCEICETHNNFSYIYLLENNYHIACYDSELEINHSDTNSFLSKTCYITCKNCDINGDNDQHNCIECDEDYIFELNLNNSPYKNCYKNCSHFHYYDKNLNKSYCTLDNHCPENYIKLILDKNECIDNCNRDPIYKYEFENICYNKSFSEIKSNSYNSYFIEKTEDIINNIQSKSLTSNIIITEFNSHNSIELEKEAELNISFIEKFIKEINISEIDNGSIKTLEKNNLLFLLTSTYNQNLEKYQNDVSIDLKECDYILKDNYNISYNNSLYILLYIVEEKGMKIPKVEYEVYHPLNNKNLTKLNLSPCEGRKIDISIPVQINDSIFKYNISSDYYNNICSKTTSQSGTDISLKDRRNEFMENNMTLCDANCKLVDYNYDKSKAKCSCDVKLTVPLLNEIKFNKEELYKGFTDIKKIANLNVMKCYKYVFNKSLIKNYGFFIMLIIFLLFLACLIIFLFHSFFKLIKEINSIVSALKNTRDKKAIKVKKPIKKGEKIFQKNLTRKIILQLNFRMVMEKIIIILINKLLQKMKKMLIRIYLD